MRRRTHEARNRGPDEKRSSYSSYSDDGKKSRPAIPHASIWLPILSHRLGIKNKRQQELFLLAWIALILVLWFLTPLSDYCAAWILWTVPIESDVELGRKSLVTLERKFPPVVDRWEVKRIGSELVKAGSIASVDNQYGDDIFRNIPLFQWDFGVVHAPQLINAFALPGGIVRVTDSLLQVLDLTDGELAALLGHEMGHVLHRHSQKRVVKNRLLATIWEAFMHDDLDDTREESFGEAVAKGLWKSASFLGELAFSRSDEYEADEAAWDLLASTYHAKTGRKRRQYHPKSVRGLLRKLWDYQGGTGSTTWESTHPGTRDRIKVLENKWNGLSPLEKKKFEMKVY